MRFMGSPRWFAPPYEKGRMRNQARAMRVALPGTYPRLRRCAAGKNRLDRFDELIGRAGLHQVQVAACLGGPLPVLLAAVSRERDDGDAVAVFSRADLAGHFEPRAADEKQFEDHDARLMLEGDRDHLRDVGRFAGVDPVRGEAGGDYAAR